MKKWAALFVVIALVCAVWYVVRKQRVQFDFRRPKTAEIDRGDIHVPITAPGRIEPIQRFEVKSKAGGEVIAIKVKPGDYVIKDEVLVELDPDLEQRNRDRADSDLKIAKARLDDAKIKIRDAEQQVFVMQGALADLEARFPLFEVELKRVEDDRKKDLYSEMDYIQAKSNYDVNIAQQRSAKARVEQAKNAVSSAELAETQQAEAVNKIQKILDDAQERLDDTTIKAPLDGIVTEVPISIGAKIQSGINSMTGGTVLLRLADVSTLEVVARVDEADWGKIADISPVDALPDVPGNREKARRDAESLVKRSGKVVIEVDAFPDEKFDGLVVRVEPQGRAYSSATVIQFDVHVKITDERYRKLPLGAQAQVTFTVESKLDTLRVPVDAVKSNSGKSGVWIPIPPPPGERMRGKKFVACDFNISDGEFAALEQVDLSEVVLEEGQEVYTRLPPDRDTDED